VDAEADATEVGVAPLALVLHHQLDRLAGGEVHGRRHLGRAHGEERVPRRRVGPVVEHLDAVHQEP
jgi:hypothetical protein